MPRRGVQGSRRWSVGWLRPRADVEAALPVVAAGCQHHVSVSPEVDRLLLLGASGEMHGAIQPDRDQRADVRAPVASDGGDPEQLGGLEGALGRRPIRGGGVGVAESRVEARGWLTLYSHGSASHPNPAKLMM